MQSRELRVLNELAEIIPELVGGLIARADPGGLYGLVLSNANLDELFPEQLDLFYSVYRSFPEEDRRIIARMVCNISLSILLNQIGLYNEPLLARIEELAGQGVPVLQYLEGQLERIYRIPEVFEQLIKEGKEHVC